MVESIKELRKLCQKRTELYSSKKQEKIPPVPKPFFHRFYDYLAIYIAKILLYTPVTANQVTLSSVIVGIIAGIFFSTSNPSYWLIGSFIVQFYFILDAIDGMIARYKRTANPIGKYFDIMAPSIVIPSVYIGMTYGIYNIGNSNIVFLFGFIIVIFFLAAALSNASKKSLIYEFAYTRNKKIIEILRKGTKNAFKNGKVTFKYTIKKLLSFQGYAFLIFITSLLDLFFDPIVISIFNLSFLFNWRFELLLLLTIISPLIFFGRVYQTRKLQNKVIRFL